MEDQVTVAFLLISSLSNNGTLQITLSNISKQEVDNNCYHESITTIPMEAKLSDPNFTCSAFTEQWFMWTDVHNCGLWSTFVDIDPHLGTAVFCTTHKSNSCRQTSQKPWSWYICDHRQNQIVKNPLSLILWIRILNYGQQSSSCAATFLLNLFPSKRRTCPSVSAFRSQVKTFLFRKYIE